jgi:chloramphenicol 3-O-phosphotransferase
MVIVVSGTIASGKSSVARALAECCSAAGCTSAVVDIDLVYEMIAGAEPRKDDGSSSSKDPASAPAARRVNFHIGIAVVVVDGEFMTPEDRGDLDRWAAG